MSKTFCRPMPHRLSVQIPEFDMSWLAMEFVSLGCRFESGCKFQHLFKLQPLTRHRIQRLQVQRYSLWTSQAAQVTKTLYWLPLHPTTQLPPCILWVRLNVDQQENCCTIFEVPCLRQTNQALGSLGWKNYHLGLESAGQALHCSEDLCPSYR